MAKQPVKVDSGILQFTPKGAYYEGEDEQFKKVFEMWQGLFNFDRTLFCLTTLLGGTGFSKGSMSHMLLSNPQTGFGLDLIPAELPSDFESRVIKHNLTKERTPRALKNLLMLAGGEKHKRVNNSRTRRIILEFIFNRSDTALENLVINYKGKLKTLIRHALGKHELYKILTGNDTKLFEKRIGRYNQHAFPVLLFLFDYYIEETGFKKLDQCLQLKKASIEGDVEKFEKLMKGLPMRTVLGYRNTYRVPIELKDLYGSTKISAKDALQSETAAKRAGTKIKVDYKDQDIYDLWKAFYHKAQIGDMDNVDEIAAAINDQASKIDKIDIGEAVIIIDASESMKGSEKRPLHPFLTTLSIVAVLDNIKDIIYVSGKDVQVGTNNVVFPSGATDLWKGLIEAVIAGAKNILVISDGYENSVKGMFEHVYDHFKSSGYDFELMHINPVFASDAKSGTTRKLVDDVTPMPISDYRFLETEIIFNQMIENREAVKQLLINKYQKLLGEGGK